MNTRSPPCRSLAARQKRVVGEDQIDDRGGQCALLLEVHQRPGFSSIGSIRNIRIRMQIRCDSRPCPIEFLDKLVLVLVSSGNRLLVRSTLDIRQRAEKGEPALPGLAALIIRCVERSKLLIADKRAIDDEMLSDCCSFLSNSVLGYRAIRDIVQRN